MKRHSGEEGIPEAQDEQQHQEQGMDVELLRQQAEVSEERERKRNAQQYKESVATIMSLVLDILRVDIEREEAEARAARHTGGRAHVPISRYTNAALSYDAAKSKQSEIERLLARLERGGSGPKQR